MESLSQDIRFAFRTLIKAPLFTTLCVLSLAVGIGVNVNIYSAVYAAFFRPFGFDRPDRLVILEDRQPQRGFATPAFAYETFQDLQQRVPGIEQSAMTAFRSLTLTDGDEPVRLQGNASSWNLFPLLGIRPHVGRLFRPEDDRPGAPRSVILGYDIWATRYRADSARIGTHISVNGEPHVLIGVMPKGFMFPEREEAWVAAGPLLDGRPRDGRDGVVYVRLRDGVTMATVRAQLDAASRAIEAEHPVEQEHWRATAIPLREFMVGEEMRLVIATMMGAVTFVLLIACANVANLLLARATTRSREIAIRTAIGANRGRIVRQLLTESAMLALIACPLGVLFAYWLLDVVLASIPASDMPYYIHFAIDGPVLLYAVVIAAVTGVLFGLAPALQALRGDLQSALKDGGRGAGTGGGRHRLRTSLVVGEVALSMMLLVGASLFVRSFLNVQRQTGGIDPANMLTLRFFMPGTRYDSLPAIRARVQDVTERVTALPGVVSVTASNQIPLSGGGGGGSIEIEGKPAATPADAPVAMWTGATDRWFGTLGVPLVAGRVLTEPESRDSSRVAVVNEAMAARFWPGENALGKRFRILRDSTWLTVVGVSRNYRAEQLGDNQPIPPSFVMSYAYLPTRNTGLIIRTRSDPTQVASAVRTAIRQSDPTLPVFEVMSMEELRRFGFWSIRLFGWMFTLFGVVALVLAAVGVYGVMAYSVSQRTQEIGVRVALGARPADVILLVLRGGAGLALAGIGIGLLGAFGVTRVIQSLLVDVSSTDLTSFAGVSLFLAAVALLACYVPARRAARVDPLIALRNE